MRCCFLPMLPVRTGLQRRARRRSGVLGFGCQGGGPASMTILTPSSPVPRFSPPRPRHPRPRRPPSPRLMKPFLAGVGRQPHDGGDGMAAGDSGDIARRKEQNGFAEREAATLMVHDQWQAQGRPAVRLRERRVQPVSIAAENQRTGVCTLQVWPICQIWKRSRNSKRRRDERQDG